MKARIFNRSLAVVVAGSLAVLSMKAAAQDFTNATAVPPLTHAASEVLKLAQGKIDDETIVAYVAASKSGYVLSADQILYLSQQGVSQPVLKAMLSKPQPDAVVTASTAATAPAPTNSPSREATPPPQTASGTAAEVPTVTTAPIMQPTVSYVQTAPTTYYYQPYYYPAYGYYYPWPYPAVSFSFGWGGRWGGRGHR